jgi:Protein O-mannosyl-transferase TMEM260-like
MPISQPPAERLLTRFDAVLALLAGGLSLALYTRTLAPSVLTSDSAEFQVLAYQLGIAHCPGYPVYLLLAKLSTFLPVRDIAYRVNLFSAFMAAVTVAVVYLAGKLLTGQRLAALFGALALAVSFTFWSQAIIAEVYTPGAVFVAMVLLGLLAWYRAGAGWALFLAGLCGGLGLGVHSTVVLLAPAVLLFLWLNRKRWPNCWRPAILGAAAGVLLYLAAFALVDLNAPPANIFNAAYAPAGSSWNLSQADLANPIQRMLFIGTAVQWRSAMFAWHTLPEHLATYIHDFPREFTRLTTLLMVAGLALLFWHEASLGWLFLTALLVQWAFALTYQISDIYVFYISGYVLLAMLAAYGAAQIGGWLGRRPFFGAKYIQAAAMLAILAFGVWPRLAPYWPSVRAGEVPFTDMQGYLVDSQTASVYRGVTRVVDQLPPNAIVFVEWSRLYAFYYAAHIEKGRTDLRFIEPAPRAERPGLPASVIDFIRANIGTHPIFFAQPWPEVKEAGYSYQPREIWFTQFYQVEEKVIMKTAELPDV